MPVYWEPDKNGKDQAKVELYETPPPSTRDLVGRYILLLITAVVAALAVSC